MSLERIRELLTQLPGHSLVYGGSHSGKLYQNYPWPPLDVLPAHRNDTQARLDWLVEKLGDVTNRTILDFGCGNGAISLGLAMAGARLNCFTPDEVEQAIAQTAAGEVGVQLPPTEKGQGFAAFWSSPVIIKHLSTVDYVLFLSVWKWIIRNEGLDAANATLEFAFNAGRCLIFESGLTDGGMDLGIGITKADIPDILRKHTGCEPELLGIEPREDGTEREVWRCQRR